MEKALAGHPPAADIGSLVVNRQEGEAILIDGRIRISVIRIRQGDVRILVQAPKTTKILREEIAAPRANQ